MLSNICCDSRNPTPRLAVEQLIAARRIRTNVYVQNTVGLPLNPLAYFMDATQFGQDQT